MKPIHRMIVGGISVIVLLGSPIVHANSNQQQSLASTVGSDSHLIKQMEQTFSVKEKSVRNVKIVLVTPEGTGKATVLFRFRAEHLGQPQDFLGVGYLEQRDSDWRMTSWGCGGEQGTTKPYTLWTKPAQ